MTRTAMRRPRRAQGYGAWRRRRADLRESYRDARQGGCRNEIALAGQALREHEDLRPMEGRTRR